MKYDPWYKASYALSAGPSGTPALKLGVPHDVFSTLRIDEGTLLLLDHLPPGQPSHVLDMGCGYGALGLPVARRNPTARLELVDRDLMAVRWADANARDNGLSNVTAYGSLGYRDLRSQGQAYDWILCNVPARIGKPFIEHLLGGGRARLAPGGELRVVVIRDLVPVLLELQAAHGWPLREEAKGPRHSVFSLAADPALSAAERTGLLSEPAGLYARDQVEIAGLRLERPFDLGGDDPKRLTHGLPVLLEALPRQPPARAFCFRVGYGVLPLAGRTRWPEAQVTAVDRDLLATTFTALNAQRLGLAGPKLELREQAHFPDAIGANERFELITGELSPSSSEAVVVAEIKAVAAALAPGGQALLLALNKLERQWIRPLAVKNELPITPMISREGYTVLHMARRAR